MAVPLIGALLGGLRTALSATATGGKALGSAAGRGMTTGTVFEGMLPKASKAEKAITGVSQGLNVMSGRLRNVAHSAEGWTGSLVGMLSAGATAIGRMADPIKNMVAIANPARAKMFEVAMSDAYGVVGRQLIPVMDAFTRTARKVGDTMAMFEPITEPLMKSIEALVDQMGTSFQDTMVGIAPTINLVIDAMTKFVDMLTWTAKQVNRMARYNPVATLLTHGDDTRKRLDKNATSMGAAAREARFIAPKQVADDAIKNAMMLGAMPKETNAEKLQREANQYLKEIAEKSGNGKAENGKDNRRPSPQPSGQSSDRRYLTG